MVKVKYETTHGKCYGKGDTFPCKVMDEPDIHCGTFRCPFYKPADLKGWIRRDEKDGVVLIPPEEYKEMMTGEVQ